MRQAKATRSYFFFLADLLAVLPAYLDLPATHLPSLPLQTCLPISQPILVFAALAGAPSPHAAKPAKVSARIIERMIASVFQLNAWSHRRYLRPLSAAAWHIFVA